MQCTNNLKQIALAANNYHDVNGCYPQGVQFTFDFSTSGHHVALLPYLEQIPLFNAMNFNWIVPWSGANTTFAGPVRPSVYVCPSDTMGTQVDIFAEACTFEPGFSFSHYTQFPQAYTSYAGNAGTWFRHSRHPGQSWTRAMACSSATRVRPARSDLDRGADRTSPTAPATRSPTASTRWGC